MADPMRGIPVIDVAPLYEADPSGAGAVAAAIGHACREIGFFYAAGHKVPPALVADSFAIAHELFALPAAQKLSVSIARSPHNRGYVGLQGESARPLQAAGPEGGLQHRPRPGGRTIREVVAGLPFRGVNLWPRARRLPRHDAGLLRRRCGRSAGGCIAPSQSISACPTPISRTSSTGPWPPCACCTIRPCRRRRCRPAGRGRAHRLRQPHAPGHRRSRRARGAHPPRGLDRGADHRRAPSSAISATA